MVHPLDQHWTKCYYCFSFSPWDRLKKKNGERERERKEETKKEKRNTA